jgi:hypothetical protein
MPIKKKTTAAKKPAVLGPKAKLMKLQVATLRNKAKKLGVSDVSKRTKENLVQSIILGEARKKRGTAAGKKATAKRTMSAGVRQSTRQTGTSKLTRDLKKKAFPPGRRVSKAGKVYYERRKNRSDKPGQLAGEKYQGWTNYWTWRWALEMIDEDYLYDLAQEYDNAYDLGKAIKDQAEQFVEESIGGSPFESWMFAVLSDINWTEIAQNYLGE